MKPAPLPDTLAGELAKARTLLHNIQFALDGEALEAFHAANYHILTVERLLGRPGVEEAINQTLAATALATES